MKDNEKKGQMLLHTGGLGVDPFTVVMTVNSDLFPTEPKRCNETTEFTCDNGECIPLIFRCDHGHDCDDASDEALCRTYPVT